MVKKIIIILIILLFGVLSFFIYSANNEKSAAPSVGELKTTENKTVAVSAKSPSDVMEKTVSPGEEIEEIFTDKKGTEKSAAETLLKEGPGVKVEHDLETVPSRDDIKEKMEKPAALVPAEAPLHIIKAENKAAIIGDELNLPIIKMDAAAAGPSSVKEKKETMPAGGSIITPQETPAPAFIELSAVGTKDIMPEREEERPLVTKGTAVPVSGPENATETNEAIPTAGKTEENMDKPEHFSAELLTKGINNRIAIFPFENFSDDKDAIKQVLPLLIDKLEKKGFQVVDEDGVNSFLCKERVRSTGYISRELAEKIRKKFNVSTILTGAIISFSSEEIPQFGVLARVIDSSDSAILWADYAAATGEDFIAILELGRLKTIFSLMPRVIDILFASFNIEELKRDINPLRRIAVMPFKNNSNFNNAGTIATYMFTVELLKSRVFMPIEYGDIRDMIIKLGIRRKGDIGYDSIEALSKELNASGIVVGVVDNYSDGADSSAAPNVGITARLVDGSNNKILWYNSSQFSGEDNIIALDWGRIRSVHSVSYKAVSSLVKQMSKKKWRE